MENVFADLSAQISTNYSERKVVNEKPLRSAFVFITAESDSSDVAFEDLKRIEGVNEVYFSQGAYDIIAKVSAQSLDHLREIIFRQIKNLSSIRSTLTLTVI